MSRFLAPMIPMAYGKPCEAFRRAKLNVSLWPFFGFLQGPSETVRAGRPPRRTGGGSEPARKKVARKRT